MNRFFVSLSMTLLLAACGGDANAPQTQPPAAAVKPRAELPVYRFATEAVYPPFQFLNADAEVVGFEPDVLRAVAAEEGFAVDFVRHVRSKWADSLNNREVDGWSSAFYNNADYSQAANASKPFIDTVRIVVSLPDNEQTQNIRELTDFKGKKIAVSKYYGQKMADLAAALTGSPDNVLLTDSFYLSARELFNHNVHGVLGANYVLDHYAKQAKQNNIKTKTIDVAGEPKREVVFLVGKHQPELLEKINRGIDKIKANGKYKALEEKWFGKTQ